MKNEPLRFTRKIVFSFINYNADIDYSDLAHCEERFPAIFFVPDAMARKSLRTQGIRLDTLPEAGLVFPYYSGIKDFNLLFFSFSDGTNRYLRSVNFLNQTVSTVLLDVDTVRCEDLLRSQRLLAIQSHPPLADIAVDGRLVSEAPLWVWLKPGTYTVGCRLTGHRFKDQQVKIPDTVKHLCQRENMDPKADRENDMGLTSEEKGGAALIYILGAAASIAAIVLPILLFF